MEILQILAIIVTLIIMYVLAYRGMSIFYLALIGSFLVIVSNSMPVLDTIKTVYMNGVGGNVITMFLFLLFGAMLSNLYTKSGAAISVAQGIMKVLSGKNPSPAKKQLLAIIIVIVAGTVMAYGGLNALVLMFALFPLTLSLMQEANIPRRFLPGIIMGCTATAANFGPGTPQPANILVCKLLGTPAASALIPGIIGMAVAVILIVLYLNTHISIAKRKGEFFDLGGISLDINHEKMPNFLISILPLLIMFVLFNVVKLDIIVALVVSILAGIVLFFPFLKTGKPNAIISTLNEGAQNCAVPMFNLASLIGFGAVVAAAPCFPTIAKFVTQIPGPALLVAAIAVAILAAVTGSAPGALGVALPIFADTFIGQMGIDPEALHRVAVAASTTLDTLPTNGGIFIILGLAKLNHKQGYFPIFVNTVVINAISTLVIIIACSLI